jgi:hypothetical protein
MHINLSKFFLILIAAFISISCFLNIQSRSTLCLSKLETKILDMIHSKNYTKKSAECKKIYGHIKNTENLESGE